MKRQTHAFEQTPPTPTRQDPFVQLIWLCDRYTRRYEKGATRESYKNNMKALIKALQQPGIFRRRSRRDPRFFLKTHCDPLLLYRAAQHWQEKKYAPMTLSTRCSTLLQMFNYAIDEHLIPQMTFCLPEMAELQRVTLSREAYQESELNFILKTFQPIFQYAVQVANGYQRTGVGMDPTRVRRANRSRGESDRSPNLGWQDWNNVIWYFENRMSCKAVRSTKEWQERHRKFFTGIRTHGYLQDVYRKLGVSAQLDIHLIAPLAVKLCWETGLNTDTLLALKRNCFQEDHPLTGLPYLRYYKARSTGEKDLHLSLLDDANAPVLPLEYKQSKVIKRTINLILKLTEPLLERANPEDRPYLFLYEPRSGGRRKEVVRLNVNYFSGWALSFRRRLQKRNEPGFPDVFTLGRFRPTKITELVRQGKDLLDIQIVSGHSSASTTLRYLASHQIAPLAQKEVNAVLQKIHENQLEFQRDPKPYATAENTNKNQEVIYKAILCDCKDVFNPPDKIKKVMAHKKGQSCGYFNMCLTCPNALILKHHLPRLVAYKREIETARSSNIAKAPNSAHYDKALAVIDGILLEFSDEDLAWAKQEEQRTDIHSDPLTYRPVLETSQ